MPCLAALGTVERQNPSVLKDRNLQQTPGHPTTQRQPCLKVKPWKRNDCYANYVCVVFKTVRSNWSLRSGVDLDYKRFFFLCGFPRVPVFLRHVIQSQLNKTHVCTRCVSAVRGRLQGGKSQRRKL